MAHTNTPLTFPAQDWQSATPESQNVDPQKLTAAMQKLKEITDNKNHEVTHHDGISQSLILRNGRILWHGPKIDELHDVWSCTKSFTGICLGLLTDDRKLSPDTLAADILPTLRQHYPTVTLRHLASFTDGYNGVEEADSLRAFEPAPPRFAPGEFFHYSMATDILAYLLTLVAGESLRDLFRRRIADPIGLDPKAWRWNDWGKISGLDICGGSGMYNHGMTITARQIARVGWLMTNHGNWNGQQLLSREYIQQMTTVQVPSTTPPFDKEGWYVRLPGSYGLNIWLNGITPAGTRMWPDAPANVFALQGNMNNICLCIPDWNMVLVRLGTDGRINNDQYTQVFAILREALTDLP